MSDKVVQGATSGISVDKILVPLVNKINLINETQKVNLEERCRIVMEYKNQVIEEENQPNWWQRLLNKLPEQKPFYTDWEKFKDYKPSIYFMGEGFYDKVMQYVYRYENNKEWLVFAKRVVKLCNDSTTGVVVFDQDTWNRLGL